MQKISKIKLGLSSPESIRENSYGEVIKSETLNYRSHKPENGGLFCAQIFGPIKDYECLCGRLKKRSKDIKRCPECGVENTSSDVRRERMGHIELAAPLIHPWQFTSPSKLGYLLDLNKNDINDIAQYRKYIVLESNNPNIKKKQLISKEDYSKYLQKYGSEIRIEKGGKALKELLSELDLESEIKNVEEKLDNQNADNQSKLIKKLEFLKEFSHSGNKPEWMILDVIPVIPPDLRPIIQLDGGRFTSSDLNDLYRKVINRNNKVKNAIENRYPQIMIEESIRTLQLALNELIGVYIENQNIDPANKLSSIIDKIKGKKGRFRQNLLGKRVDFSGRSVIVVGPSMKIDECGIPKKMALELFKPMITGILLERGHAINGKVAKKIVDAGKSEALEILEELIKEKVVLLNRAPTLHRLGIQAFYPKLVDGKAIKLHPLVCDAYNADFDGDQMAVHLPLSEESQKEAKELLIGSKNVLNPKDGNVIIGPSQDMILGNYYLTMDMDLDENIEKLNYFDNIFDMQRKLDNKSIKLNTRILFKISSLENFNWKEEDKDKYLITSAGKVIFNSILPKNINYINEASQSKKNNYIDSKWIIDIDENSLDYINKLERVPPLKKKNLEHILEYVFDIFGTETTANLANTIKDIGYKYSTSAGFTISAFDVQSLDDKQNYLDKADKEVKTINDYYNKGLISEEEKYKMVTSIWVNTTETVKNKLLAKLDYKNEIFMMSDSGARGNASQFSQLAGMRGLMSDATGKTIEIPVKSSFIEGLNVLEYFTSTHGARKGSVDTALRTADAGYLTRTLVDVVQDTIIREDDCHTDNGFLMKDFVYEEQVLVSLKERIKGRYSAQDYKGIIKKDELITEEIAQKIINDGISEFKVRSSFTCESRNGICAKCYGIDLSTSEIVKIGVAVGVIAAQSIGEPGTQLTMRTFHTGGVAGDDITSGFPRLKMLFDASEPYTQELFKKERINKKGAIVSQYEGTIDKIKVLQSNENGDRNYEFTIKDNNNEEQKQIKEISRYHKIIVKKGDFVSKGDALTDGVLSPKELLSYKGKDQTAQYLINEIQKVYRLQGVELNDKHIEIIAKKMLGFVKVVEPKDSRFSKDSIITMRKFYEEKDLLEKQGKEIMEVKPLIIGVKKASILTDSFLSAASFQEVSKTLNNAAHKGQIDDLFGLKENVMIGNLIPAGTGLNKKFIK